MVIGTPDFVLHLVTRGTVDLSRCAFLGLENGDELLARAGADMLLRIRQAMPNDAQVGVVTRELTPLRLCAARHIEPDGAMQLLSGVVTEPAVVDTQTLLARNRPFLHCPRSTRGGMVTASRSGPG